MKMIEELKPCPFCGSTNIALRFESVVCRECDGNIHSFNQEQAIKAWNTRPADSKEGDLIK